MALVVGGSCHERSGGCGSFPHVKSQGNCIVFFKPVDNNMAHQTFLGTGMRTNFDFVAQLFTVIATKTNGIGEVTEVRITAPSGPPLAMKLSDVAFEKMSSHLKIWKVGATGFEAHAKVPMHLASIVVLHCFNMFSLYSLLVVSLTMFGFVVS